MRNSQILKILCLMGTLNIGRAPNKKVMAGMGAFLGCLLAAMPVQADVSIGPDVITTHTEIKVLGPGPDLQEIIQNIVDTGSPAVDNPYLIKLGPGVYPITAAAATGFGLLMESYISITGSGQGVTVLTGEISTADPEANSAIVIGVSNAVLSDLSVENTGSSTFAFAIFNNNGNSPLIQNVTATTSGAALSNETIRNQVGSSPTMINVTAMASGAVQTNNAVSNIASSSPVMTNVTATAVGTGTSGNIGVYNSGSSVMSNVTATASGGTSSTGMYIETGSPRVDSSTLSGTTAGLNMVLQTGPRITNTLIIGGIVDDDVGTQCRNTYKADLTDEPC